MMTEEKNMIGIDFVGINNAIGSVVACAIEIKPTLFREYGFLNIRSGIKGSELNKVVELTRRRVIHYVLHDIVPDKLDKISREEWEIQAIIALLNNILKFWEHKIHIRTSLTREKFDELYAKFAPMNLKIKHLNTLDWNLEPSSSDRLTVLANLYGQYQLNIQNSDIAAVWGDIRDPLAFIKAHPECPHIRKSSSVFRQLWPNIKPMEEENHDDSNRQGREKSKDPEGNSIPIQNVGNEGSPMEKKV